jgi:hypothetical protein
MEFPSQESGRFRTFTEASGRRFDFSVLVDNGKRKREFLIEIHGKQHYEFSFLGDKVGESDRLKK